MMDRNRTAMAILFALLILIVSRGGASIQDVIAPSKVTSVVYVHEQRDTVIPSGVAAAFNELNRQGILAQMCDKDVIDGAGEVPDQLKIAIPAAEEFGLPALVVLSGDTVVKTIKAPQTKEQVLEEVL